MQRRQADYLQWSDCVREGLPIRNRFELEEVTSPAIMGGSKQSKNLLVGEEPRNKCSSYFSAFGIIITSYKLPQGQGQYTPLGFLGTFMKSFLRMANASRTTISSGITILQLWTCSGSFEQYTCVYIKSIEPEHVVSNDFIWKMYSFFHFALAQQASLSYHCLRHPMPIGTRQLALSNDRQKLFLFTTTVLTLSCPRRYQKCYCWGWTLLQQYRLAS
jgi:hypothetical protein